MTKKGHSALPGPGFIAVIVAAIMLTAALLLAGCAGAAPAPTPTKAPAAPTTAPAVPTKAAAEPTKPAAAATKPAEPTKPAAAATTAPTKAPAAPTTAPASKVSFPEKGRAITFIIPFSAGGAADIAARVVGPLMEKELGVPVQLVNREGAGSQVGLTELFRARPDGYTIGATHLPTTTTIYLDSERQPVFGRDGFVPIAGYVTDPDVLAVQNDSPFKSLKDVIDAAKAAPEKVKAASTAGKLSTPHLAVLLTEQAAGVKFATVLFDGGGPAVTALLGGHVDLAFGTGGNFPSQVKTGAVRVLGLLDRQQSPYFPGVKTYEEQGYKVYMTVYMGISAPKGTPKEIIDVLAGAVRKGVESGELKAKMDPLGLPVRFMDTAEWTTRWGEMEESIKPLMSLARQ